MFPAASSILEQDVITEDCLKRLIKDDLQMTRLPRNLDTFYFFFSIYKKFGMQNTEKYKAWKKGKHYFSVKEVVGDNGEVKMSNELTPLSTSTLKLKFGLCHKVYKPYYDRYTKKFKSHIYSDFRKECAQLEWTEEAHNFFMPLLEAYIQGKFIIPTSFKRQMNEYEMSSDIIAKIGGYELKTMVETQEKLDNHYDETGAGNNIGVYNKRYNGRKKNAQKNKQRKTN